ncbi:hypothetical protein [Methylomagnum sp.]
MRVIIRKFNLAGLTGAFVVPNIVDYTDLVGAYWFTSGVASKCLHDHSGQGNTLRMLGNPLFKPNRVVVGGGHGFDTGLTETGDLTYMVIGARDESVPDIPNRLFFVGNCGDDTNQNGYGVALQYLDSPTQKNNVASYRSSLFYYRDGLAVENNQKPGGANNASPFCNNFVSATRFQCWAVAVNCRDNSQATYILKAQSTPALETRFDAASGGGLAKRPLVDGKGLPIKVQIGVWDNPKATPRNAAIACVFIWKGAVKEEIINAQYKASKAQLLALDPILFAHL